MNVSPVDFASLLCSRLCHDLLSPVGALNNGLELLADETDPAMRERCMELLADSARASANKLKFFRLAFGAGGGFADRVDMGEAKAAIEGLLTDNRRTTLGWLVEQPSLPKPAVRILMNLALIATEALARGGTIDIGAEAGREAIEIAIRIEGPRILLDPEIRRTLMEGQGAEPLASRTAPAFLVHTLTTEHGGMTLVTEPAPNTMILGAAIRAG